MFRLDATKPVQFCDGLTRRDFLHAGSLTALGLGLPAMQALAQSGSVARDRDVNCILLFLVGGPSQLDTWDMKPEAPEEIRGPFRPIATKVPGIQVSEVFPRLATLMDKVSLVRTVYHTAAAVHDTGHQMMQTGRLFSGGTEHPPYGSVLAKLKGSRHNTPPYVVLPKPIGPTGGNLPHGHAAGYLGKTFDPFILNADPNDKAFKVPDLLPPDYVTAVRESRRRSLRSAIDGPSAPSRRRPTPGCSTPTSRAPSSSWQAPRRARRSSSARSPPRSVIATAAPGSVRAASWHAG